VAIKLVNLLPSFNIILFFAFNNNNNNNKKIKYLFSSFVVLDLILNIVFSKYLLISLILLVIKSH
jgi:hypothetical protein